MATTSSPQKLIYDLYSGNSAERRAAARALVDIGDDEVVEALIKALQNFNEPTRRNAAWALGEIGLPSALLPLKSALKDPDPLVRKRAAEALDKMDNVLIKMVKKIILKPTSFILSHVFEFSIKVLLAFQSSLEKLFWKTVNSVSLLFGTGIYDNPTLSSYYSNYSSGHGMTINIDMLELHSKLPAEYPCENCGTNLQKITFGLGAVGSCEKCNHIQTYAAESLRIIQAQLVRRKIRGNKELRKHFYGFLYHEFPSLYKKYYLWMQK